MAVAVSALNAFNTLRNYGKQDDNKAGGYNNRPAATWPNRSAHVTSPQQEAGGLGKGNPTLITTHGKPNCAGLPRLNLLFGNIIAWAAGADETLLEGGAGVAIKN